MEFVISHIPDGVPFRVFAGEISDETDVTDKVSALFGRGVFHVVEGAGKGVGKFIEKTIKLDPVSRYILKAITPKSPETSLASTAAVNDQYKSPNNSLTDRSNKARPYERSYDICGTVQTIPSNLMATYQTYAPSGRLVEYGYYEVARGEVDTPASGITDGDTLLSDISGSSAAVYAPFTSPNNGTPITLVGDAISEPLYITVEANQIDGQTLKAKNDLLSNVGSQATASVSGSIGTVTDPTGDADFSAYIRVGSTVTLTNIVATGISNLSGSYVVTAVSDVDVKLNVSANLAPWTALGAVARQITAASNATVGPANPTEASFTDWAVISKIKPERVIANISAANGMYKDAGTGSKTTASVTVEMQFQALDDNLSPYGDVHTASGTITSKSPDETGVSVIGVLPTASAVRVRCRRVTDADLTFSGQVVDEVKYTALYGQVKDTTPHYGDRTTVHTARKQTPRAASVKSPKLGMVVTERLYRYMGGGVFDTAKSNNTQAVQSLIRLLRDERVGNLTLSSSNMDRLLAVQTEIEAYFGTPLAGQFCYTFDDYSDTTQDVISTIAEAIFCVPYREGSDVLLDFERPRSGPEMVFTHRSKAPAGEKWVRKFKDRDAYDSLQFGYIDPATNIKETISLPDADLGTNTEQYDSKGIRNYKQAFIAAWRRFKKAQLGKVTVEFTAMEEGIFAKPGRPISVVKGSRVAPYDGYVIAVNGLTLTLSQPVVFEPGKQHSVILKKRDGTAYSVDVTAGASDRQIVLSTAPQETIYTGNSELKTEFSFGTDDRHAAQMIMVSSVEPSDDRTVKISGYNYSLDYYSMDGVSPFGSGFDDGFDDGFG